MEIPLYFYLAYDGLERLSPGSADTTLKAIDKVNINSKANLNILDIGCGVGSSTILLANYFENSEIEAIDLFKHYLDVLNEKIAENNFEDRVFSYCMDMKDPDFANEEFDIVFAESSIEVIGFRKGLKEWKRLLKPEGYMIVSDISWIKKPSAKSVKFWKNIYSEVDSIENKMAQIRNEGYEFIDYVIVPKEDWKEFHKKLEKNLDSLRNDKSAKEFVNVLKKQITFFRENSDEYSYVFYIMKKC